MSDSADDTTPIEATETTAVDDAFPPRSVGADQDQDDKSRYLLDGRRVLLTDLIEGGLLHPGAALRFSRHQKGIVHRCSVSRDGGLRLYDGRVFRSPSRAAAVAAGLRAVDGWHAWVVEDSGVSLDALRQRLLSSAARAQGAHSGQTPESSAAQNRFNLLQVARQEADDLTPRAVQVRQLLAWWGAKSRGTRVTHRIEADLANHGLVTSPNFRKVTMDTVVRLETAPAADETAVAEEPSSSPSREVGEGVGEGTPDVFGGEATDEDDAEERDGGVTVGNLASALTGITSVPPDATFEQAITLMLLNDYSQLAVLSGGRTLRGAITWKSIAQARHANPAAAFRDAIVPAREVPYDKELIDCLRDLEEDDFLVVRDETKMLSGIITTADVVNAYGELATPFLLIGELDRALRYAISRTFSLDEVRGVCVSTASRIIDSFDDLSIGDYQQVLANPQLWSKLGWPLDRSALIARLDELRDFRNDVMHFNPDPAPPDIVGKLRNCIQMIRDYCDRG